jgi:hypothetical protein
VHLLIHILDTRWGEWSASHPVPALPPGKGPPQCPVDKRLGLDTKARGIFFCFCRGSNLERPVIQSADTILTELPCIILKLCVSGINGIKEALSRNVFSPEEGDRMFLRNVDNYLWVYTASKTRTIPSFSPTREQRISHSVNYFSCNRHFKCE